MTPFKRCAQFFPTISRLESRKTLVTTDTKKMGRPKIAAPRDPCLLWRGGQGSAVAGGQGSRGRVDMQRLVMRGQAIHPSCPGPLRNGPVAFAAIAGRRDMQFLRTTHARHATPPRRLAADGDGGPSHCRPL
jgi:hypothetical protein